MNGFILVCRETFKNGRWSCKAARSIGRRGAAGRRARAALATFSYPPNPGNLRILVALSLSLSLTHTHTHSRSLSHTHTNSLSHTLSIQVHSSDAWGHAPGDDPWSHSPVGDNGSNPLSSSVRSEVRGRLPGRAASALREASWETALVSRSWREVHASIFSGGEGEVGGEDDVAMVVEGFGVNPDPSTSNLNTKPQTPKSVHKTSNLKTLNPEPQTPKVKPQTPEPDPKPQPQTPNPEPQAPNPKPQTPNPESQPLNPKPQTSRSAHTRGTS